MTEHVPVLLHEVLDGLAIQNGDTVCDATIGGGGYTKAMCEVVGSDGVVVGIDQDADAVALVRERCRDSACQTHFVVDNFRNLHNVLTDIGISTLDGCVFDLGFSSIQLEDSGRGFSFQKDEPLLMTLSRESNGLTAQSIVNEWAEEDIANVLYGYGEERKARKIAKAIVEARKEEPIETTNDLVEIIERVVPKRGKKHPATRTFQALRIAVNDELGALKDGLEQAVQVLGTGKRVAVVSFHSLEDRIVKQYFRSQEDRGVGRRVTKKPIAPSSKEVKDNPRARSAKLRIFEKVN